MDINARAQHIEIAVVDLLEDYGITQYPLDVVGLANRLGVSVVRYDEFSDDVNQLFKTASPDAFTIKSAGQEFTIFFNSHVAPYTRARFSIAHELGHIWLEHFECDALREIDADYFSGYLLMPHPLILFNHMTVASIMNSFKVGSWSAEVAFNQAKRRQYCGPSFWHEHERRLLKLIEPMAGFVNIPP